MKIGVFGGSFNPVHCGHLILAEHAADAAELDRVILVPAYESPFKTGTGGEISRHLLQMTRIAAEQNPRFEVSSMEIDKGVTSYTIDTMRAISAEIGTGDRLSFIMGADSFASLEKWRGADELLREYSFLVGCRPGCALEETEKTAEQLRMRYNADIRIILIPQVDISSTDLRNRVRQGKSIRYLTPDGVAKYIAEFHLYEDGRSETGHG